MAPSVRLSMMKYDGHEYISRNPDWHVADSPWKAAQVKASLRGYIPKSICEIGCGAGEVLRQLHDQLPSERLVGYDIAPHALELAKSRATDRLSFTLADPTEDGATFDLMLVLDVIEHVRDPIGFLEGLRFKAPRAMFHIPLDISVQSVLRPGKLLRLRETAGHIHYFTPETGAATVSDAGYQVIRAEYTAGFTLPPTSLGGRIARIPREIFPTPVTVRLLGGYSLLVTAQPR
jgi:SAM-dependent methyltransferase